MGIGLKTMSENHDGYFEVAVVNIMGSPRIWDFYSPPRNRKEESEELCDRYIAHMREADEVFRNYTHSHQDILIK